MRDVITELKALRLHGMAATWAELGEQNNGELERSRWLLEHMLKAEARGASGFLCVRPLEDLSTAAGVACDERPTRWASRSRIVTRLAS